MLNFNDRYENQVYTKYVKETLNDKGQLQEIDFTPTDNFNFAYDVVDYLGENKPEKRAMVWLSKDKEEKVFTFKDMMDKSNQTANYLKRMGIKKGDKVLVVLKRHYQFWFTILALHKLGAVTIPATHQLTQKDYEYRFNKAEVSAVICTAENDVPKEIDKALPESPSVKVKIVANGEFNGYGDFDKEIEKESTEFERVETSKDDYMLMYFTSGTTAYPKIAAHSYTYALGHLTTAKWWHQVDPNGVHFTISDTGWGKSVWGKLYGQWLCESCVFTYDFEKFVPADILSIMQDYKITTFCAPPTMYRFFMQEDVSKYDLSSLQHTTIAGEALNPEVFYKWKEYTGLKLTEGFGQTETTLTIATLFGTEPKPGSMGKPNPQYDADIVDVNNEHVQPGEVGEIVIRTNRRKPAGLFKAYYLDTENTKSAWYDDIYHTGDTAWYDEDGYFWFVGRTDDLIKSSGYRIGPFEIESVVMEHESVLEVAVIGVPDEIRGQAVKAYIVLKNGFHPSDELKKEIQNYVKDNTAPYKYPRVIEFVEELPKTISGKIKRVDLRGEE